MSGKLKVASFFAGIGGFDLGFERAGMETVYQCEIDKFCNNILHHHWPHVKKDTDITTVDYADVPESDVWCGGFPCQDLSLARARSRDGLNGKRSGLFYRFADLLSRTLPSIVVLENVPGLLTANGGRDFRVVIQTLAELGYGVGWRVLNSRYFGVPQSRQRVYIVGCHRNPRRTAEILFEPECGTRHLEKGRKPGKETVSPFMESVDLTSRKGIELIQDPPIAPKMGFCLAATSGRHTGTDWSRTYIPYRDRVRRLTPEECEGLQGFPKDWTMPDGLFNTKDDIDSLRYHALGNAVSVPVTEWLGQRILATQEIESITVETLIGEDSVLV
ncbi:DNA cytosine methyltransferase [Spirosoma litoris]